LDEHVNFSLRVSIGGTLTFVEILLAGSCGVVCLLTRSPLRVSHARAGFLAGVGRLERLRRSRWQWFSMVLLMLILRVQHLLPPSVEVMVASQFLIFLVAPVRALARSRGTQGFQPGGYGTRARQTDPVLSSPEAELIPGCVSSDAVGE